MEEPVTDGDGDASHRQLVLADVVNPISHSISSSSSITPLSPNSSSFSPTDGSAVQKVPGSDGIRSSTATRTNILGTSKFTLPEDWSVEKVRRKFGGVYDKYYRDPQTGRYFRSLKEVERYITEGVKPTRTKLKNPKHHPQKKSAIQDVIVADTKMVKVEEDKSNEYQLAAVKSPTSVSVSPTTPHFQLPYGWVVKEVPRSSGDYVDKYYYEPGSGQKFRSLLAVQKHVEELEENAPLSLVLEELREDSLPISKAFKLSNNIKNHGSYSSWKKSISRKEKTQLDGSPPRKINWVIGEGSDTWNAFVDNTLVSDSVKQQWGNNFMTAITNAR